MEISYWLSRWNKGKTGFHSEEINSHLKASWPLAGLSPGATVFVPLCGRSLDMQWLAGQGYRVVGVEASEKACRMFFEKASFEYEAIDQHDFTIFKGRAVEIWCGDYFKLKPSVFPSFEAIYDRAALVALPPRLRQPYVQKMVELAGSMLNMLLISFTYDQEVMSGPPFSVPLPEIQQLFGSSCTVEELGRVNILEKSRKFSNKGLTDFLEISYLVKTK